MNDKVCIFTEAISGLGKATAMGLAKLDVTVILACRDKGRGEAAQAEIVTATGIKAVDLMLVDLSAQQSISAMVANFKQKYSRLDVLVNNAAVFNRKKLLNSPFILQYLQNSRA